MKTVITGFWRLGTPQTPMVSIDRAEAVRKIGESQTDKLADNAAKVADITCAVHKRIVCVCWVDENDGGEAQ